MRKSKSAKNAIQGAIDFGHELIIDNFAGGGGVSAAIRRAFGRDPDVAINHSAEALAMHAANHPNTAHYPEDVFNVDPRFVTRNQPIGLCHFSPDCTHHSKAKGGKPREQKIRGLAWICLKWAAFQMPRCMSLENVEEFLQWGPLDESGQPIKAEKGRTFRAFVDALSTGLDPAHPDAGEIYATLGADFPMSRLYAGLGYKVEWKILRACDYGAPTIRKRLFMFMRRDGRPIVWPAPTHGDPKAKSFAKSGLQPWRTAAECIDWSIPCKSIFGRKKPLADATLRRIAKGLQRYVLESADPFIVGQGGPAYSGKPTSVEQPLGTVTKQNHRAIVIPKLAPFITECANSSTERVFPVNEPLRTQVAQCKGGHFQRVDVELVSAVDSPIVAAHIQRQMGQSVGHGADEPLCSITAGGMGKAALVTAFLAKHYTGVVGSDLKDPLGTVTSVDHHSVVEAHLVHYHADKRPCDVRASDLRDPLNTITTENRHALVTAHLTKLRGDNIGSGADEPLHTVSAGGMHHALACAYLIKYYGNEEGGHDIADPLGTVTTGDRFAVIVVWIKGDPYIIVDIGLRMLTPRELAKAQGFPDDYILDPIYNGKPLNKTQQVRMIGNSVSPPVAEALFRANFGHETEMMAAA